MYSTGRSRFTESLNTDRKSAGEAPGVVKLDNEVHVLAHEVARAIDEHVIVLGVLLAFLGTRHELNVQEPRLRTLEIVHRLCMMYRIDSEIYSVVWCTVSSIQRTECCMVYCVVSSMYSERVVWCTVSSIQRTEFCMVYCVVSSMD